MRRGKEKGEVMSRVKDLQKQVHKVLKKIDDISFCNLTSRDVVRHPLVQMIVKAYEDYEKQGANEAKRKAIKKRERH